MNGKHPIDDLFARGLRDAEATPPPAVWQGIVRERGKTRPVPAEPPAPAKTRRRWGLAALLLLLLGAAGYWATGLAGRHDAQPGSTDGVATTPLPLESVSADTASDPILTTSLSAGNEHPAVRPEPQALEPSVVSAAPEHSTAHSAGSSAPRTTALPTDSPRSTPNTSGSGKAASNTPVAKTGSPVTTAVPAGHEAASPGISIGAFNKPDGGADPTAAQRSDAAKTPEYKVSTVMAVTPALADPQQWPMRTTADEHLEVMRCRPSLLGAPPVANLGPVLKGDSTPSYVVGKGNWWLAAQVEWAATDGSWRGTGAEVAELNASETWRGQNGFGFVVGRSWLDRWTIGLGIGITKQRSRFLRHEVEEGRTETVIDTTWTATAMGTQTNYTWDIVETLVEEPGIERDFTATNTYTRLRIAPELGHELVGRKRATLSARIAPTMLFDLGRKGRTVAMVSMMDSLENVMPTIAARPLDAAAFDRRFQMAFALSLSLEARYQLHERLALSLLPTYTYWLQRTESAVPTLSMSELGAAVRLRYDFRHRERRVK